MKVLDTGPITNHVNFARTPRGQFAYVTVGRLNLVKVFRTSDFERDRFGLWQENGPACWIQA